MFTDTRNLPSLQPLQCGTGVALKSKKQLLV
jgi:hypothetical protein